MEGSKLWYITGRYGTDTVSLSQLGSLCQNLMAFQIVIFSVIDLVIYILVNYQFSFFPIKTLSFY